MIQIARVAVEEAGLRYVEVATSRCQSTHTNNN